MYESYWVSHLVLPVIELIKFSEEGGQLTHTSLFCTNKLDHKKVRKRYKYQDRRVNPDETNSDITIKLSAS